MYPKSFQVAVTIAAIAALLAVVALDPTNYGAADRLERDLAALDALTPHGLAAPPTEASLQRVLGRPGLAATDDRALDIHWNHNDEEQTHEPIPKRAAADVR